MIQISREIDLGSDFGDFVGLGHSVFILLYIQHFCQCGRMGTCLSL